MKEENCIFCKIINGEIPNTKIYEDKDFLAFLDIKPVSYGHTLIIPKKHCIWMQEADDETISKIFVLAKKIMLALKNGLLCDYVQLSVVGNEVPHFHIHLIPRHENDNFKNLPTIEYKEDLISKTANKITQELSRLYI